MVEAMRGEGGPEPHGPSVVGEMGGGALRGEKREEGQKKRKSSIGSGGAEAQGSGRAGTQTERSAPVGHLLVKPLPGALPGEGSAAALGRGKKDKSRQKKV